MSHSTSPDFEVLSTTSQDVDELFIETPNDDDKIDSGHAGKEPAIPTTVNQFISLPAEVYEALIYRITVLENKVAKMEAEYKDCTLVKNVEVRVPIVVSADAIAKGINDELPGTSTAFENQDDDAYPYDDGQDWGLTPPNKTENRFAQPSQQPQNRNESDWHSDFHSRMDKRRYNDGGHDYGKNDDVTTYRDNRRGSSRYLNYEDDQRSEKSYLPRRNYSLDSDSHYNTRRHHNDDSDSNRSYVREYPERQQYRDGSRSSDYSRQSNNTHYSEHREADRPYRENTLKYLCVFCNGEHSPDVCQQVRTHRERRGLLISEGRCEICLSRHLTSRCHKSKVPCKYCNDNKNADLHHFSICPFEHR